MRISAAVVCMCLVTGAAFLQLGAPAAGQLGSKTTDKKAEAKLDDRVKKIFDEEKIHYDATGDGVFKVIFNVGTDAEKRSQLVFVNSRTETYGDFEIREIWSIAKKAPEKTFDAEFYRRLLEDSQAKKLGAWSILTTEGQDYAVFSVKVAADVEAKQLKDVLEVVLETADEREKKENDGNDEF